MKKETLNIEEIIEAYKNTPNLHSLAKQFHTSHIRLSNILKENNIAIQNIGKRKDFNEDIINDMINDYVENHITMEQIAQKYQIRIKRLRQIFRDKQVSISKWNGHVKKEKVAKREKINRGYKECPICGWRTYNISENSLSFQHHLEKEHGYNPSNINEYIKLYSDDSRYLTRLLKNTGKIKCEICGKYVSILDDRHLSKHGISKVDYIAKYNPNKLVCDSYLNTLRNNMQLMNENPNWERYSSSYEKELQDFLSRNNIKFETHNRTLLLDNKEIDIYIPEKNIAIEFNGCLQHTEWFGGKNKHYHLDKTLQCNNQGVSLIHIFEDEYVYHKDIVYSKLSHLLHIDNDMTRIGARKCSVSEIFPNDAYTFLEKNHIQGYTKSTLYLGAYYNNVLIGVMSFKKELKNNDNWELTRFATDNGYICCGLGDKLFKYFTRNYSPTEVKSFADRRWTLNMNDNLYTKLGFKCVSLNCPDYHYYYLKDNKPIRFHKFGFRKQILHKKYNLPLEMSETEMVKTLGYDRIWDCGLIKYVWKKDS